MAIANIVVVSHRAYLYEIPLKSFLIFKYMIASFGEIIGLLCLNKYVARSSLEVENYHIFATYGMNEG
jgi:hypothetical protein